MTTIEIPGGTHIRTAITRAIEVAVSEATEVNFDFNGSTVRVGPTSTVEDGLAAWHRDRERRRIEYVNSEAGKKAAAEQAAHEERLAARKAAVDALPKPTWKDPVVYAAEVERQMEGADGMKGYVEAIIAYAEAWASTMEAAMRAGSTVADCADAASHDADYDGITGFMYGCAVCLLAEHWIRGEELRRWHNLTTQIRDEGERANESGGVLNPAILVVGGD